MNGVIQSEYMKYPSIKTMTAFNVFVSLKSIQLSFFIIYRDFGLVLQLFICRLDISDVLNVKHDWMD